MKKRITVIYEVCVCLAVLFLLYLFWNEGSDWFAAQSLDGFQVLEEHSYETEPDEEAPLGTKEVYTIRVKEFSENSNAVVFHTVHQNVAVYIEDQLVYRIQKNAGGLGRTPGSHWNTVQISSAHHGKDVRVEIQPVYESSMGKRPVFYVGLQFSIYMEIIKQYTAAIILSIAAIILGLIFMIFTAYNHKNQTIDRSLFMMGQAAVMIGIWKITDTGFLEMLFGHEEAISNIPFLALLLFVVPYMQYARELFTKPDHWIWDLSCAVSLLVFVISLLLQVTGIADLREMLWLSHFAILQAAAVIWPVLYFEIRKYGWNRRRKTMAVCMTACTAGLGADMVFYYRFGMVSGINLGIIGFLVYVMLLGATSLENVKELMSIGIKAGRLEKMAYYDQMTGLFNRASYAEDVEGGSYELDAVSLIVLDLNELKHCNDTYGHEKGDLYITSSAELIQQVFGSFGKCYRMGGDEFCVIMKDKSAQQCEKLIQSLKKAADSWNRHHSERFLIQIAAGYAIYDQELDYDISDMQRRADKMMYRDKYAMKQEKSA